MHQLRSTAFPFSFYVSENHNVVYSDCCLQSIYYTQHNETFFYDYDNIVYNTRGFFAYLVDKALLYYLILLSLSGYVQFNYLITDLLRQLQFSMLYETYNGGIRQHIWILHRGLATARSNLVQNPYIYYCF